MLLCYAYQLTIRDTGLAIRRADSYQVSCNEHVLCWFGQLLVISIGGGLQPQILHCNTGTGGGNWLGTRAVKEACELTKAFLTLHSLTSVEKMLHIEKRHNKSYRLFNSSMFVVLYAL